MQRPSSLLQSANALAGSGLPTDEAFQLAADLESAFQSWPRPGASQQHITPMQVSDTWSIPTSVDSLLRALPPRYICIQRRQARLTSAAMPTMHSFMPCSLWSPDTIIKGHMSNSSLYSTVVFAGCYSHISGVGWILQPIQR